MFDRVIEQYHDALLLLARILLSALFVISGTGKLFDFAGTTSYLEYVHVPMSSVAAVVAIAVELLGGLALLLGIRVRVVAVLMIVFVAAAAVIGHPFWSMEAADRAIAQTQFLKNLSIIGGLLLLLISGAGRYAATRS